MAGLNIVVLVKGVPDFREGKVKFKEDNTLDRGSTPTVLNPNDQLALQAAREVQVKHGGTVSVMSMGPPNYKTIIRQAMDTCGDKGYLLSDIKLAGADTWATAWALSTGIKRLGRVDLVFAGFKTADGETGQTGPQTALILNTPLITHVTRLAVDPAAGRVSAHRMAYDEIEECEAPLPAFIVTDPGFTSSFRRASERLALLDHMEAQKGKAATYESLVTVLNADALQAPEDKIGLRGSPTIVRIVEPIPKAPSERTARVLDGSKTEDIEELAGLILARAGA